MSVSKDSKLSELARKHASSNPSPSSTLCRSATSHGSQVWSLQYDWHVSFEEDVEIVSSTSNGDIVAVITSTGVVTMLRGSDGHKLGCRRLSASVTDAVWVVHSENGNQESPHALLLVMATTDASCEPRCNVTLVRNLTLQSADPPQVSTLTLADHQCSAITGIFPSDTFIRLLGCSDDDRLFSLDWNYSTNESTPVSLQIPDHVNARGGLLLDRIQNQQYFIFNSYSETTTSSVDWMDASNLESSCRFALNPISKATAIESLKSDRPDTALLAVAVYESPANQRPSSLNAYTESSRLIHVLQVLLEKTMGSVVLCKPHVLYSIPLVPCLSVELAASPSTPLWFHFKVWHDPEQHLPVEYLRFEPSPHNYHCLAQIKRHLQLGQPDAAERLLQDWEFVDDEYTCFSPCEVPLRQLQNLLTKDDFGSCNQLLEQTKACWNRLADEAAHAVREGRKDREAVLYVLQAVDDFVVSLQEAQLHELERFISLVLPFVDRVLAAGEGLRDAHLQRLTRKQDKLVGRLSVIRFLSSLSSQEGIHRSVVLDGPMRASTSIAQLYETLVQEHYFSVAELLWQQSKHSGSHLLARTLLQPILKISPAVSPRNYCHLLERAVIPALSINHEGLRAIRSWACRTADALDDDKTNSSGLCDAIYLLEVIERSSKVLQFKIHESFAEFSPFEGRATCSALNDGLAPVGSKTSSMSSGPSIFPVLSHTIQGRPPTPTILSLGSMQRGPMKVLQGGPVLAASADPYESNDNCVSEKLTEARCLRDARLAGLPHHDLKLKYVVASGGPPLVARKLIGMAASLHDDATRTFLRDCVEPFCTSFSVDMDSAIFDCVESRCREKLEPALAGKTIPEIATIARCCRSDLMKAKSILCVLRASLFYGYYAHLLETMTRDALAWSSRDSGLQSEIEEASRLLLIDGIIIRYCGRQARGMFRVDCPRHAVRLLQFVAQHSSKESVLRDALALCDAFSHLSSQDAGSWIMQNAFHSMESGLCASIMSDLYSTSHSLAERVFLGILSFAEELVLESSKGTQSRASLSDRCRRRATSVCECVIAVATALLNRKAVLSERAVAQLRWLQGCTSFEGIRSSYLRIKSLQTDYGIFASLSELRSPRFVLQAVSQLVQGLLKNEGACENESKASNFAKAKKACLLLVPESISEDAEDYWVSVAAETAVSMIDDVQPAQTLEFMKLVGILKRDGAEARARALLSIARTLSSCTPDTQDKANRKEGWKRTITSASILRDCAIFVACWKDIAATLSFGSIVETAYEMLSRCDEGLGEAIEDRREELRREVSQHTCAPRQIAIHGENPKLPLRRSPLHPSWFVGDGLLLPPDQSLSHSVDICRMLWDHPIATQSVISFLSDNGAHVLSLRVVSCSATLLGTSVARKRLGEMGRERLDWAFNDAMTSLAERCLGGSSQVGLTSGKIDSQLATAFLLSLPLKKAFKMYLASIPSSLKARDFARVQVLAMVGLMATANMSDVSSELGFVRVGWKDQNMFHEQCQGLAVQASWWAKLKRHGVLFETRGLEFMGGAGAKSHEVQPQGFAGETTHAMSLLPTLVKSLSKSFDSYSVLEWCIQYAEAFDLSKGAAIQAYVEWCLAPKQEPNGSPPLNEVEKCVPSALRKLELLHQRSSVLRRCLVALESSPVGGDDYERYAMVLAMYHESLVSVIEKHDTHHSAISVKSFEMELDLVDRRRDVISILMAYFDGARRHLRPSFPPFFLPLTSHTAGASQRQTVCGILGKSELNTSCFDPLEPLTSLFETMVDQSIVTALSPMCLSLGLPQGYLHARFLMTRFKCSAEKECAELPSYDNDVVPTLSRIRSASERTVFAEWCANQYRGRDEDRLKCLDGAIQAAMQASSEAENSHCRDVQVEENALATVKRLTTEKAFLADTLRVKRILRAGPQSYTVVNDVLNALAIALDEFVALHELAPPEEMIDFLLSTGSLLAANASLDPENPLPTHQLRHLCSVLLQTCSALTENHSHVNLRRRCKQHVRNWLFHGDDETVAGGDHTPKDLTKSKRHSPAFDDDDVTANFKMDLNGLHDDDIASRAGALPLSIGVGNMTSEEERSTLCGTSLREKSETAAHRSAIRIAFVLALSNDEEEVAYSPITENSHESSSRTLPTSSTKVGRLFAALELRKGRKSEGKAFDHGRELMGIVFARSFSELLHQKNPNSSIDEVCDSFPSASQANSTLTFAMRHRALCAAAILCPQEALERVLVEDTFTKEAMPSSPSVVLCQCTFGLFVAKEIEELGLPLPHSNMLQLSSMNFPSYARALWRDHRDDGRPECQGRLLLLLVEMSLRADAVDATFVVSLLEEMKERNLTRSLHLACERILAFESTHTGQLSLHLSQGLDKIIAIVWNSIFSEIQLKATAAEFEDIIAVRLTLSRFGTMILSRYAMDKSFLHRLHRDLTSLSKSIEERTILTEIQLLLVRVECGQYPGIVASAAVTEDSDLPHEG